MKVEIYSTPTCPYCLKAKEYFKKNNIAFTDYDVSIEQERSKEIVKKSGQMGVPVILIDDKVVIGFDKEKIDLALGL